MNDTLPGLRTSWHHPRAARNASRCVRDQSPVEVGRNLHVQEVP